ncbi:MAG: STAS domain-containing protein [Candidatus Sulfotelmatobacter sp.]|jgi:anti-sigma B factor antagonist
MSLATGKVLTNSVLEITVIPGGEATVLLLNGRVNIDSSPALRDRLLAMLRANPPVSVVIDLAGVTYMDASGIATVVEALKIATNRRGSLRLRGLHGTVQRLLEVTGVSSLFETNAVGANRSETSGPPGASSAPKVF